MKLWETDFGELFMALDSVAIGGGGRSQSQRLEWLRRLSRSDNFFDGAFDASQTNSSRHPLNWLIALALRLTAEARTDERSALEWYAAQLLTCNQRKRIDGAVLSGKRVGTFLKLDTKRVRKWETARLTGRETPCLSDRETLEHLQNAVRLLLRARSPVPVARILDEAGSPRSGRSSDMLFAGLRYLLFYPCLHRNALCLAAWPTKDLGLAKTELAGVDVVSDAELEEAKRPHLSALPPPLAQPPEVKWAEPRLPQDIFCFLQTAMHQRLQMRTDGSLYASSAKAVATGLSALPDWISLEPTARANAAFAVAYVMEWITVRGRGRQSVLITTPAAEEWLAKPPPARTAFLLDRLRDAQTIHHAAGPEFFPGLPMMLSSTGADEQMSFATEVRDYLREFFARFADGAFYAESALLAGVGAAAHPFRRGSLFVGSAAYRHRVAPEQVDELWELFVSRFLHYPLHAYGGLLYGVADGNVCVGLTAAGRYLLGLTDELPVAEETGRVVLQPNFELVFMAPSPSAVAALAPYCRRLGSGQVGTLLCLDRKAVLAAASRGADADSVLAVLSTYTESVPENVAAEVRSWCDSTLHVRTRRARACPERFVARF